MRYINNYEKFKESRNWGHLKSQAKLNLNERIDWSDVKEGLQVLRYESLNEGLLGDIYNKAKEGVKSIASKIPGVNNLFKTKEVKQVASELLQRDDIDEMLRKAYDKVVKEKGEVTPRTIEEVAEEEEQRPVILPAIGSKQLGELTTKQKWIGRALLTLILLSVSIKASGMQHNQEDVKLDKMEMTKNLKGETVKGKTIKLSDAMGGADIPPTDDGSIEYLHSSSSASKAYQSELGEGGDFDKGLQRGADGTYKHVYEITLGEFYKIVDDLKTGKIDKSNVLNNLRPLNQQPDASNPNLFQIGDEVLKAPNGKVANKLFDMKGKDETTKIRLSGNGLYNFGRLIEAASKMGDNKFADFIKITFGSDVKDDDARGAYNYTFDANGIGKTVNNYLNKAYDIMLGGAFLPVDFEDRGTGMDKIPSLLPKTGLYGIDKSISSTNYFGTVDIGFEKDGIPVTLEDIIKGESQVEGLYRVLRGTCKKMVEDMFRSFNKDVPPLLTEQEIKNMKFTLVDDNILQECIKYFKDLQKQPGEKRLKAKLDPSLEKKFIDNVNEVVKNAVMKYIDFKLQGGGDQFTSLPTEVIDAIKADVIKQLDGKFKIHDGFKNRDLTKPWHNKKTKRPTPTEKNVEDQATWTEGGF